MNETMNRRLLGPVMFWTVLTTLFAWLPLVRIIGRPEGYTWSILGLSGDGLDGPFWIFIPLTAYAITMLFTAARGPRALFHPLLVLWHLIVTGVVIAALVQGGGDAMWQGQGLHLKIPLWILAVPFVFFAVLAGVWAAVDRSHPAKAPSRWSARNTFRLLASLLLLVLAIVLFRTGTNYNWVTALAIGITIIHWIVLAWSFESVDTDSELSGTEDKDSLPAH